MSVSINVFILLNIFLIACSAPNFMHRSKCHRVIFIINVTLESIRSFRTVFALSSLGEFHKQVVLAYVISRYL